jgi:small neutral amino acid transporter SnatA (MarC family)
MTEFIKSTALLLVLLNPFLVIIYLIDMVEKLDRKQFTQIIIRAGLIASVAFSCFAILGDAIFSRLMHAEFASFQIFGGVIFLLIGLQFVFQGPGAINILRGQSEHLAGAIAMPVLVGPGTISASVVIGKQLEPLLACVAVLTAVAISLAIMLILKVTHDYFMPRKERVIHWYVEIAGRVLALFVGTIAIEMIMQGVRTWVGKF